MESVNQQVYFDQLNGPAHFVSKLIVEELYRTGVSTFAVAPGARLIPLLEAVKGHQKTSLNLFNDERQAAFWAMGHAKATNQPTALLVTSGTAVANLLPGVMEAYYSKVPLIVITCDRPWELQKSGANQTVRQSGIFAKYVLEERDIPAIESSFSIAGVLANIDHLVQASNGVVAGPVHLNIAFRRPYQLENFSLEHFLDSEELQIFKSWYQAKQKYRHITSAIVGTNISDLDLLVKAIDTAKAPLLVAGPLQNKKDQLAVTELADKLNAPVFADINSSLRGQDNVLSLYNLYLEKLNPKDFDLVIYLGDRIVSERLREFIASVPAIKILINNSDRRQDVIENEFIHFNYHYFVNLSKYLAGVSYKISDRKCLVLEELSELESQLSKQLNSNNISIEGNFLAKILRALPADSIFYHSSSLILRELEYYACPLKTQVISSNRGCVGIDGVLASAIGYAQGKDQKTFLAIGDQALHYDLTSLSLVPEQNFCIFVINNAGGAVFKTLETEVQSELINNSKLNFKNHASAYGLKYLEINKISELEKFLTGITQDFSSQVVEINCDANESIEFFTNYECKAN